MGGVEYSCYPHNTKWLFFPVEENAIRSIYLSGISLPESKQKNKKKKKTKGGNHVTNCGKQTKKKKKTNSNLKHKNFDTGGQND